MKTITRLSLGILLISIVLSCSNSDSDYDTQPPTNAVNYDYFPKSIGNTWNYDITNTDNLANLTTNSTDEVVINSENGNSFTVDVNNGGMINGVFNSVLSSGVMTKTESDLKISGTLSLALDNLNTISIDYTDAVAYDNQAAVGATLYSYTDSFIQTIQGQELNYNFTLSTQKVSDLNSYTVNDISYTNVTQTDLTLNLSVTTFLNGFEIPILNAQNILQANCYFAADVGPIAANTNLSFQLNQNTLDLLNNLIDTSNFVTSVSTSNIQQLSSYNLN